MASNGTFDSRVPMATTKPSQRSQVTKSGVAKKLLLESCLSCTLTMRQFNSSSQKVANLPVFRLLLLSFIALRVIACPVCCAGGGADAHGVVSQTGLLHSDGCCRHDGEPCGEDDTPPADSSCPCEGGCECQLAPESHQRVVVDAQWILGFAPLSLETLDLSKTFVVRFEEVPRRLDLPTGRSVRIAHASYLL